MVSGMLAGGELELGSIITVFGCSDPNNFVGQDFPFLISEELKGKRCAISFSNRSFFQGVKAELYVLFLCYRAGLVVVKTEVQ